MSSIGSPSGDRGARLEQFVQRLDTELRNTRRRLYRLEALAALKERGRAPTLPVKFPSQYGEDFTLWDLFSDQADGFYIEVGAYDGLEFSVTYAFESIGWKGLLVEALPDRHARCVVNRPNSRVVHAALSRDGSTGTASFESVEGEGIAGMFSFLNSDREHIERVRAAKLQRRTVTVPLTSMNALLADHRGPIDFAVIDVEGGEIQLLQGFDLARYRPRVLVIEDNWAEKNSTLSAYMSGFPYRQTGWVGVNRLYIRDDETALLGRAGFE